MAVRFHQFKRIVLGLHPSAPDRSVRYAAELAGLLELELLGIFLEDTRLLDLAALPFAREFRPFGGGWRSIDLDQLSHDLDLAARASRRLFAEAVKQLPMACRFEVVRGPTAQTIASISGRDDIVMVIVPVHPVERATQQFAWLIDAAFRSAAAIMLVPTQIVRQRGPVVALAASADDASIPLAASIAAAAGEKAVVIQTVDQAEPPREARIAGEPERRWARKAQFADTAGIQAAFGLLRERLVVIHRESFDEAVPLIVASSRQVPVLVIDGGARG